MPYQDLALDGKRLAEDAPLWRYIKLSTLLYLLKSKRSFLPKLGKLQEGDRFEGVFCPDYLEGRFSHLERNNEDLKNWLRRNSGETKRSERERGLAPNLSTLRQRELMKRRLVWCWFHSEAECMAQWRIYGKEGVAIRSDVASVRSVLQPQGENSGVAVVYGKVCYLQLNHSPDCGIQEKLWQHPYFIKHAAFEHEKEVRFALADDDPDCPGRRVVTEPSVLIKEVVVSPYHLPTEATGIVEAIKHLLPEGSAIQARISGTQDPDQPAGRDEATRRERLEDASVDLSLSGSSFNNDLPALMRLIP